jgi:hypothetical protein
MTDYDSPWKEALDLCFQPFMHFCFPALSEHIDWSVDPKMLDKVSGRQTSRFCRGYQRPGEFD